MRSRVHSVALASLGGLTGGMILVRFVLLPFWRRMPPSEFRSWFAQHGSRVRSVMVPFGAAALATSAADAVMSPRSPSKTTALAATAGVVGITAAVNEPMNARFVAPDLGDMETVELLERWRRWHDVRVTLGTIGLAASLRVRLRSS